MRHKAIAAALLAISVASCSLKEELPGISGDNYYRTESQCRSVVNGVYIPLQSIFTSSMMLVTEAQTDLWNSTSTTQDAQLLVSPSKPQHGAAVWSYGYRGVDLCNEAIARIGDTPYVEDSVKNVMTAECRVMRAFYYYYLTCMFNGVPFYTDQVNTYAVQDSLRYLPRTDANEIRRILYDDIKYNALPYFTEENGLKCRACEAPYKRSGYALGLMLMAKFAMWYEDWDAALEPLNALEDLYGEFNEDNYPLEDIPWRNKHIAETIFEVQHEYDLAGVQYYGSVAKFMMPPHSSGYVFDGVTLYGYGNTIPASGSLRTNIRYAGLRSTSSGGEAASTAGSLFGPLPLKITTDFLSSRNRYAIALDLDAIAAGTVKGEPLDRRAVIKFGMGNLDTGDTFTRVVQYGSCWPGPQFWCPDIINNCDSNNYRLFRYADAVLMMAECWCKEQNSSLALEYLNKIRRRAGVAEVANFSGYEDLMLQIRAERARELGGEMQRKFDLVRWGVWYEQTLNNTDNSTLKANIRPCHEYYPIPDVQCALSGYVLDNPAYDESDTIQ